MEDPSDIDDYSNWMGGFYELSITAGPTDDSRLERSLVAVWRLANATGPFTRPDDGPSVVARLDLAALSRHIHGVVRLPIGRDVVCGATAIRFGDGPDVLSFYIPLAALARIDPRIQGFPFGDEGGAVSLDWRRPIDHWLAELATRVYAEAPFQLASIGFEASSFDPPDVLAADRDFACVVPVNVGPRYYEATG